MTSRPSISSIRGASSREANRGIDNRKVRRNQKSAEPTSVALSSVHRAKMEKLLAACRSLHDLEGDDQKVKTRWINEVESYFRPFRVCVVHCTKDPIEVIECIADDDMDVTWRFLTKLMKDRTPYWTRCEEVLRILMLSSKWMKRFHELNFDVEDLPPAVQGEFADELEQMGGSTRPVIEYRLDCDNAARLANVRSCLDDMVTQSSVKIVESEDADITVCFSYPSRTEDLAKGVEECKRCISTCIPQNGGECEALNLADFWPQFIEAKKLNLGAIQVIDASCLASDPYDAPCVAFATLILHFGGPVAEVEVAKVNTQYVCTITHTSGCGSILRLLPGADGIDAPKVLAPFVVITCARGQVAFDTGKLLSQLGSGDKHFESKQCGGLRQACAAACTDLPQRFNNPAKGYSCELVEFLTSLRSRILGKNVPIRAGHPTAL